MALEAQMHRLMKISDQVNQILQRIRVGKLDLRIACCQNLSIFVNVWNIVLRNNSRPCEISFFRHAGLFFVKYRPFFSERVAVS